jgi:hypothetical protein
MGSRLLSTGRRHRPRPDPQSPRRRSGRDRLQLGPSPTRSPGPAGGPAGNRGPDTTPDGSGTGPQAEWSAEPSGRGIRPTVAGRCDSGRFVPSGCPAGGGRGSAKRTVRKYPRTKGASMKKVVSGGPARAVAFPQADAGLPDTTFFIFAARPGFPDVPVFPTYRKESHPSGKCYCDKRRYGEGCARDGRVIGAGAWAEYLRCVDYVQRGMR